MHSLFPAPFAEFLEFDFALHLLLVFVDIIIAPFANGAPEAHQIFRTLHFCHGSNGSTGAGKNQYNKKATFPQIRTSLIRPNMPTQITHIC